MVISYSSFENLTEAATKYLIDKGKSAQTIEIYNWIWKKVKFFMDENNIRECTPSAIADYLNFTWGSQKISSLRKHQKHCFRCAMCLMQFAETNKMTAVLRERETIHLSGEIGNLISEYVKLKRSLRFNEKTLRSYEWYLYKFLQGLNDNKIYSCETLSPLIIMKYCGSQLPTGHGAKHLALTLVRGFLKFLFSQGKTQRDLSLVIPNHNYKKQAKLPSIYTKEEVCSILDSIDRSTPLGKRNYAFVMLAVRLGMRASDISALEYKNILWAQNSISFFQSKTNRRIELPLPADVGECIIDYIKYARLISDSNYLFLEKKYPHDPICSRTVSICVNRIILKSGVKIGNRKHGPHALRHTMAGLLLKEKTSLLTISELLGHSSIQTSMCYLRIDTETLRQCSLEAPEVPEAFYTQRGGAFYE